MRQFFVSAIAFLSVFGMGCRASLSTDEIHAPNMHVVNVDAQSAFMRTHKRVVTTTDELPPQAGLPGYGGYGYGRGYPGHGPHYGGGHPSVGYPTIVVASVAPLGALPAPSATLVAVQAPQSAPPKPAQQGEVKDTAARGVIKDTVNALKEQEERIKKLEEQTTGK